MDVEGRDHAPDSDLPRGSRRRGTERPRPTLRTHQVMAIPKTWPEAVTYRAGVRLFSESNDAVWTLIRAHLPLHQDLDGPEMAAKMGLPDDVWERWFTLGWSRAAEDEEGG